MLSEPRPDAQTSPTSRAAGSAGDLVDELDVARARRASPRPGRGRRRGPGPRRRGTSSSRRGRSGSARAGRAGRRAARPRPRSIPGNSSHEPLGVVAGVGVRALGEEDPDERPGPLALGRGGERGGGDLVGGEAGLGRPPQHLGHDPGQRLGAASLRRPLGDVGARAVSTRDVAGIGQTTIDRPDRVGVHSQGRTKLAHGRQARAGQQPTGVDLVGQLPVDLGRDRDVRIALDIERPAGRPARGARGRDRRLT